MRPIARSITLSPQLYSKRLFGKKLISLSHKTGTDSVPVFSLEIKSGSCAGKGIASLRLICLDRQLVGPGLIALGRL
jgi:hypothetical protein